MKALLSSVLLFLSLISVSFGQYTPYKYGKLEESEMRMTTSPFDDEAPAVIIFDRGKTYFPRKANNFEVVYERTTRIKILSEEGVRFATIKIPLYSENEGKEKLADIKANIWNKSGDLWKVSEMKIKEFEQKEINDNYSVVTLSLPNVEKGTIIEYTYEISSPFFSPIRGWEFQNSIPTLLSTFEIRMIPFYEYTFLHQGKKLTIQNSYVDDKTEYEIGKNQNEQYGTIKYKEKVYTFGMSDMPGVEDNATRIDFQLSKTVDLNGVDLALTNTWQKVIKELLSDDQFGDFIEKSTKKSNYLVSTLKMEHKSEHERLYSIVRLVKDRYKWDGVFGKYASNSYNDFQASRNGNTGSINLYTVGLLRAAGINAFPVIVQTKKNSMVNTDYPFLHLYDYVLVAAKIDGKVILVDATDPLLPDNHVPMHCLNSKGLIIQKFNEEWLTCSSNELSETTTTLLIDINAGNTSSDIILNTKASGYDGYILRDNLQNDNSKIIDHFGKKGYTAQTVSINTEDYKNYNEPYSVSLNFSMPLVIEDQKILIDPFLNEPINKNPLKDKTRDYTTDFYYNINKAYHSEIIIPDGYSIGKLPEAFEMKNSMIEVNYTTRHEGNKIVVDANYKFLKVLYPPSEYERMKNYLEEIVKRFNEPVVLVKSFQ